MKMNLIRFHLMSPLWAIAIVVTNAADLPLEVTKELELYKNSKDPGFLQKAYHELRRVPAKDGRGLFDRQLDFLSEVASLYDPNYDTNPPPLPTLSTEPPPGSYDSSLPREAANDPVQRAAYEKRIAENSRIARVHLTQRFLRKIISDVARGAAYQKPEDDDSAEEQIKKIRFPEPLQKALEKEMEVQKKDWRRKR